MPLINRLQELAEAMDETTVVSLGETSGDADEIRTAVAREAQARGKCISGTGSAAPSDKPWKEKRATRKAEAFGADKVCTGGERRWKIVSVRNWFHSPLPSSSSTCGPVN